MVLVFATLGRREAAIVGLAVVLTLASTLFASWAWGFTLNRVSLFALIFSIGILVDDAIVVVENIHRHRGIEGGPLAGIIPEAVDEVGGPTILATLTVIAALLPMAFVTGLMGPYMSPIPINASMGMLISLAIAFTVTPWLALKLLAAHGHAAGLARSTRSSRASSRSLLGPFITAPARGAQPPPAGDRHRASRSCSPSGLAGVKLVVLKMLPFDNKSEFQVVVDMPAGTPVEVTAAALRELGAHVATVPEVTDYQAYAGLASPINFNGLVRQYYLRSLSEQGDLQVNLRRQVEAPPQEPRDRRGRAPGARGDRQALGREGEGGRGAAGPAGALAHRGRGLRPRRGRAHPRGEAACARRSPPPPTSSASTTPSTIPRRASS